MPFSQDRFKRAVRSTVQPLFAVGRELAEAELALAIKALVRKQLGGVTREDMDENEATAWVAILFAAVPEKYRKRAFHIAEEAIEDGPLGDTLSGNILVALLESSDNEVQNFVQREQVSEEEAVAFIRDKIIPNLRNIIPQIMQKRAERKAAGGDSMPSKHSHPVPKLEGEFTAAHLLKFSKLQMAMLMAIMDKPTEEARADSPDYDKFLGIARQTVEGAKFLIAADVEAFIKFLPSRENGTIDRALINEVREDPFENEEALELIHLCVFTYMAKTKEWVPPHLADMADALLDFNAFKAWIKERKAAIVAGAEAAQEGGVAVVASVRQPPKWVKDWEPAATRFLKSVKGGNLGLAKLAARLSLSGILSLVGGTVALIAGSLLQSNTMIGWGLSWSLLAVGVPLLFGARIIMSVFDTQLTFLARAAKAVPVAFKGTLETFKINLPTGERDPSVSQWPIVNVGRDNATMVTIVASLGELVVSVIAAFGMMMALSTVGFSAISVLVILLVLANMLKDFAFVMGEATVRERLRMLESAPTKQEIELRDKRARRSWHLSIAGGVGLVATLVAMLVVGTVGTAVVVSSKTKAAEQAAIEKECEEALFKRNVKEQTYGEYGFEPEAYCVDNPNDPDCYRCR